MIDDSNLLIHGAPYDPVKAREYYLRTRKLKGRRPSTATKTSPGRGGRRPTHVPAAGGGKANRSKTKSRRAELEAQKKALEKRLDHLREVLQKLVAEAKGRSGVKKPKHDEKGKAPETQADKADRNKHEKSQKPLTAKQKSAKAKASKKAYEKEHPNSLSQDVDVLQAQVKDIQAKIQKAVEDARERRNKAGKNSSNVRPKPKNQSNDGPRGR